MRLSDTGTWSSGGTFTWTSFEYTYDLPESPPLPLDCFDILEVSSGASLEECRTAWRRMAKTHHPDVGGDAERFKLVGAAWDAIRKHYEETI